MYGILPARVSVHHVSMLGWCLRSPSSDPRKPEYKDAEVEPGFPGEQTLLLALCVSHFEFHLHDRLWICYQSASLQLCLTLKIIYEKGHEVNQNDPHLSVETQLPLNTLSVHWNTLVLKTSCLQLKYPNCRKMTPYLLNHTDTATFIRSFYTFTNKKLP